MKIGNCPHSTEKELKFRELGQLAQSHTGSARLKARSPDAQDQLCLRYSESAAHLVGSQPPGAGGEPVAPPTTTALCPELCTAWTHPGQPSRAPLPQPPALLSPRRLTHGQSQQSSWTLLQLELATIYSPIAVAGFAEIKHTPHLQSGGLSLANNSENKPEVWPSEAGVAA